MVLVGRMNVLIVGMKGLRFANGLLLSELTKKILGDPAFAVFCFNFYYFTIMLFYLKYVKHILSLASSPNSIIFEQYLQRSKEMYPWACLTRSTIYFSSNRCPMMLHVFSRCGCHF